MWFGVGKSNVTFSSPSQAVFLLRGSLLEKQTHASTHKFGIKKMSLRPGMGNTQYS